MSVLDSIADLATGSYTVTRRAAPTLVKGRATAASSTTTFSVVASLQPVSGRDVENFPEGVKTIDMRALYTSTVEVMPERPGYVADIVTIEGEAYSVATSRRWDTPDGETFWIVFVSRVSIA